MGEGFATRNQLPGEDRVDFAVFFRRQSSPVTLEAETFTILRRPIIEDDVPITLDNDSTMVVLP